MSAAEAAADLQGAGQQQADAPVAGPIDCSRYDPEVVSRNTETGSVHGNIQAAPCQVTDIPTASDKQMAADSMGATAEEAVEQSEAASTVPAAASTAAGLVGKPFAAQQGTSNRKLRAKLMKKLRHACGQAIGKACCL